MKNYGIWLKTEYKRAAALLPSVFIKAVITIVLMGMAVCGVARLLMENHEKPLVQIGYDAPNDQMTQLAVSYIENMGSLKSWCILIPMDEKTGINALEQGDIAAFLLLPETVAEGIMSGNNQPAQLYIPKDYVWGGRLFQELAGAGVGMLKTAQAEIYATHMLVTDFSLDSSKLENLYQQIDAFNLQIVINREQLFHTKTLSITENLSLYVYYGGAILAFYLMFLAILWGKHFRRSITEIRICTQRLGIAKWKQLVGRISVIWTMLAVCFLPIFTLWWVPAIREILRVNFTLSGFLLLVLSLTVTAVWIQLVCLVIESSQVVTWILVLFAIVCGYFSGCFIPASLLPDISKKIAFFLPTTYFRYSFSALFSGMMENEIIAFLVLSCWIIGLSGACFAFSGKELVLQKKKPKWKKRYHSTIFILAKRLLLKKSIPVCLLLTLLLSILTVKLEEKSDTTICAGIYAEDKKMESIFSKQNGIVEFVLCESEEELKRNIVIGKMECGYVLQEGLQKRIMEGKGNWGIKVYQKADSTMTMMVNEVLFERLFYDISSAWFEGYIANHDLFEMTKINIGEEQLRISTKKALSDKLSDGSTFSINVIATGGSAQAAQSENHVITYPVWWIMGCNILFCAILGVKESYADRRKGRFPKRNAFVMSCYTIVLPIGFAIFINAIILFII